MFPTPTFGNNNGLLNTQPQLSLWNNPNQQNNTNTTTPLFGNNMNTTPSPFGNFFQPQKPALSVPTPAPQQQPFSFFQPQIQQQQQQPQQQQPSIFGSTQPQPQSIFGQPQPQPQQPFAWPQSQQQPQQQQPPSIFGNPQPQPQATSFSFTPQQSPSPQLNLLQPQQQQQTQVPCQGQQQPQNSITPNGSSILLQLIYELQRFLLNGQIPPSPAFVPSTYVAPYPHFSNLNSNQINFAAQLPNGTPISIAVPTGHASSLAQEEIRRRTRLDSDTTQVLWSRGDKTNNLESFLGYNSKWTSRDKDYVLSSPSFDDLLPTRSLERKRASTALSQGHCLGDRYGHGLGLYSPPSTNSLYSVWHKEIDRSRKWGGGGDRGRSYENYCYGDPYYFRKNLFYRGPNRHLRYLSTMGECEKGERLPGLTLETEFARKWKTLEIPKPDLESRWATKKAAISHRDLDPPTKSLFGGFRCKRDAYNRASGPPLRSDGMNGGNFRDHLFLKKDPEVVAHLPKRLEPITARPKSQSEPQPSTSRAFQHQQKGVRFSSTVGARVQDSDDDEEPQRKMDNLLNAKERKYNQLPPYLRGRPKISQILDQNETQGGVKLSREQLKCSVSSTQNFRNSIKVTEKSNEELKVYHSRAGVKLSRPGYYCTPDLEALDNLINPENGGCFVEEFEVGHVDHGKVVFDGIINVAGLNLDSIVDFSNMSMEFDVNDTIGNIPATVTLKNVWSTTNKDSSAMVASLIRACEKFNGRHVSYDHLNGIWIFRINENERLREDPDRVEESND